MYLEVLKTYWKESLAYRAEFMVSVVFVPLRFLFLIMIWSAVFFNNAGDKIGGYSLESMITYFLLTSLISSFIYNTIIQDLEHQINKGDFAIWLLKPVSYLTIGFLHKIANRSFALLVEIVPILLIFIIFFREYFILGVVGYFILSLILAFILSYLICLLIGMIAFWLIKIRTLAWLIDFFIQISAGVFVPLNLFPEVFQKIFAVLPFKYIIFVPANIYLGNYSTNLSTGFGNSVFSALIIQLGWCVLLFLVALFVWGKAKKRFSGVGA